MRRRPPAALLAAIALLQGPGCAIDDAGFVRTRHYASESAYVVELEAWGLHLITNAVDGGLTLGHTKKTYFFAHPDDPSRPAADGGAEVDLGTLVGLWELTPIEDDAAKRTLAELGTPIAYASSDAGVMLYANDERLGAALGAQVRTVLRLPRDYDGILVLNFDSTDPAKNMFLMKEAAP